MKRADGHATLAGGDRDQVVEQIADLCIARRDILLASGSRRGITVSTPTNDDVAEISQAIRVRLKARGEIAQDETVHCPVDQRGREYDLALAVGDRVRLFRRTWGKVNGNEQQVGNNGDVVEILATTAEGLRIRTNAGDVADVEWRRLAADQAGGPTSRAGQGVAGQPGGAPTGRLLLGFGHALTIDAAQGITSDEHINALPRGTAGVTGFTTYVAESRSRGTTWTVVSDGALYEAEHHGRALGDITPITTEHLWDRVAADMSEKPYKTLGIDLLNSARQDRERAIDIFIKLNRGLEEAQLKDPLFGVKAFHRLRAAAVNEQLGRHLLALDVAIAENKQILGVTMKARDVAAHFRALRAEAARTKQQLDATASPSSGPSPG
jgi:hypothetical protein